LICWDDVGGERWKKNIHRIKNEERTDNGEIRSEIDGCLTRLLPREVSGQGSPYKFINL